MEKSKATCRLLLYCLCIFLSFYSCNSSSTKSVDKNKNSFEFIDPTHSGVNFENKLEEGLNTNVLMYEYFYNGGGVAAADFNNDGFIDLYFTSNMGANKLYLNQSTDGFSFTDVSESSGAQGRNGPWKTGVSIVDINADGRPDIYLCYSGAMPEEKRRNQLFINTTPLGSFEVTFEEKAAEYGLDSPAHTTMAYFFDYDRDGDLDAILLNHNPKNLPNLNEGQTNEMLMVPDNMKGTRLMQNNDGKFADVTEKSGINGSELSYGLGLGISDLNQDGWPDMYISNDYNVPDYLYINNQNGTFTNTIQEAMTHTSHFSMGNDIADVNNDGLTDIMTLDMLPEDNKRQKLLLAPDNWPKFDLNVRSGFHHQFMRNMLQMNNGNGTFSEVGQFAGLSNTDWSWSSLIADFDNDGWRDVYVTNGYLRDFTNLDFINYMDQKINEKGRFSREDVLELIEKMPASDVNNYMFKGNDALKFSNVTQSWGLTQPSNSNGALYADLDNDGDLDLVVNNINKQAFIIKNNTAKESGNYLSLELKGEGQNTFGIGTVVKAYAQNKQWIVEQNLGRGFQSSVSPIIHIGLGKISTLDSVIVEWPLSKTQVFQNVNVNQRLYPNEADATLNGRNIIQNPTYFSQVKNFMDIKDASYGVRDYDRQPLLLKEYSKEGPCMELADINNDGIGDLIFGGIVGVSTKLYLGTKTGGYVLKVIPDFEKSIHCHDATIEVFDANGDGQPDIYIGSGGYHQFAINDTALIDRLYINNGNGNFTQADMGWSEPISTGVVCANDINGDGFMDLFIGGSIVPGRWPEIPKSAILINDKTGKFIDKTQDYNSTISNIGMVTDANWTDLNGDGTKELIIIGEWMPITIFELQGGKLVNVSDQYFDEKLHGLWNALVIEDVNRDGILDILASNFGTNHQLKAVKDQITELYYNDYDDNGSIDPILCTYIMNSSYPYITRDELLKQLVRLKKKFPDYKTFADAKLSDVLTKEEIKSSKRHFVNHLETTLFLGQSSGKYKIQSLPPEIQYSSVHNLLMLDVNNDGNRDLVALGNNSHLQLKVGMVAANYGQLFIGDGKGNFTFVPQYLSGINVKGDVRSVVMDKNKLMIGATGLPLQTYIINNNVN
jgi:enediyne biosynthesis protein E4